MCTKEQISSIDQMNANGESTMNLVVTARPVKSAFRNDRAEQFDWLRRGNSVLSVFVLALIIVAAACSVDGSAATESGIGGGGIAFEASGIIEDSMYSVLTLSLEEVSQHVQRLRKGEAFTYGFTNVATIRFQIKTDGERWDLKVSSSATDFKEVYQYRYDGEGISVIVPLRKPNTSEGQTYAQGGRLQPGNIPFMQPPGALVWLCYASSDALKDKPTHLPQIFKNTEAFDLPLSAVSLELDEEYPQFVRHLEFRDDSSHRAVENLTATYEVIGWRDDADLRLPSEFMLQMFDANYRDDGPTRIYRGHLTNLVRGPVTIEGRLALNLPTRVIDHRLDAEIGHRAGISYIDRSWRSLDEVSKLVPERPRTPTLLALMLLIVCAPFVVLIIRKTRSKQSK